MLHPKPKIAALITPLVTSIVVATLSSTAQAKDGFSLGTQTSNATFSHTIERNTGSNTNPSITARTEESDIAFGLIGGYQFHLSDDFFLGIEAFYNEENVETRNINNLLITELELNNSYGFNLKAGVDVTDKFSVYGLLGQTTLDFDINNSYTFAPPTRSGNTDVDEITFGIGAEYDITDSWSFTARYIQLNDVNFDPLPEVAVPGKINDNQVDYSALSFGVNFNF